MQARKGSTTNVKRVSAEDSVCIRKSPKAASSNLSVLSNLAAIGEETGRWSKNGGEGQHAESAKSWFDDSNKNVSSERGQRFYADEDPPFFLKHKSSSDESMSMPPKRATLAGPEARDLRNLAGLPSHIQTVESSSEDFRSVIDDLTIENRKLKKRLRKYERIHCGQLQSDKLFELRVHGLPASKKRKLERTLQEFALGLGDAPEEDHQPSAFAQNLAKVATKKPFLHHNASSSGTSNSRTFADSAYASMSNNSSHAHVPRGEPGHTSMAAQANDQAVRSYLQSLSRGLLPKSLPMLTETTKKEVVVQRLEQLFTGSRDHSSKDSQSKQQQEVSQSAATADRKSSEALGKRVAAEGRRESKILTAEEEVKNGNKVFAWNRTDTDSSEDTTSSSATPDQRPTRPLDLDPSRAQVPEDNIEYMKHLGFGSPPINPAKAIDEDEGWIYLNLLTGMAQLHILNVTPEFVRTAIRDISTQFELSPDGTRIRWKGAKGATRLSSDSGELSTHSSNYSYEVGNVLTDHSRESKSVENQSGTGSGNNHSSNEQSNEQSYCYPPAERHRPMLLSQTNPSDSRQYRPLFHHDTNHSDESNAHSYDDKDSSLSSGPINSTTQNASGPGNGTNKKGLRAKASKPIDPIIFYNRAKFYTDLSKDDEGMSYNCPIYTKVVKTVIGMKEISNNTSLDDKGPISKSSGPMLEPETEPVDDSLSLAGFDDDSQPSSAEPKGKMPVRFEASGIGGVVPGDHFAIDVDVRVGRASTSTKVSSKILASKTTEMLPSTLPPPSYAFLPFSSSSEEDSDDWESEEDVNMDDEDAYEQDIKAYIPPKFLNAFSSEDSNEEQEDDDMSDDSSIDMLAHAREAAPEKVAAAEREFEKYNIAREEDQMTDVAPPASSIVATLGDQSFDKDEGQDKHGPGSTAVSAAKPLT